MELSHYKAIVQSSQLRLLSLQQPPPPPVLQVQLRRLPVPQQRRRRLHYRQPQFQFSQRFQKQQLGKLNQQLNLHLSQAMVKNKQTHLSSLSD